MLTTPPVKVQLLGTVGWTAELPGDSSPAGPAPGAGGLVVGGFTPPSRPHLEVCGGGAEPVGWFTGAVGDGRSVVRFVASGPETIPVAERVRGAVGRDDGAWVLTADTLCAVDPAGRIAAAAKISAVRLLGLRSAEDSVWALDWESASFVTSSGSSTTFASPWSNPTDAAAYGDSLIGRDRDRPGQLAELRSDGSLRHRPAGFDVEPQERLLAYDGSTALFSALRSLRRAGRADDVLEVLGCGGTADGGAFAALHGADGAWLFCTGVEPQPLQLGDGERVLAVSADRVLLASRTHARWIPSSGSTANTPGEPITLNEESYVREVEPHAWQISSTGPVQASSPSELLLSASGPNGAVVVTVEWPVP